MDSEPSALIYQLADSTNTWRSGIAIASVILWQKLSVSARNCRVWNVEPPTKTDWEPTRELPHRTHIHYIAFRDIAQLLGTHYYLYLELSIRQTEISLLLATVLLRIGQYKNWTLSTPLIYCRTEVKYWFLILPGGKSKSLNRNWFLFKAKELNVCRIQKTCQKSTRKEWNVI